MGIHNAANHRDQQGTDLTWMKSRVKVCYGSLRILFNRRVHNKSDEQVARGTYSGDCDEEGETMRSSTQERDRERERERERERSLLRYLNHCGFSGLTAPFRKSLVKVPGKHSDYFVRQATSQCSFACGLWKCFASKHERRLSCTPRGGTTRSVGAIPWRVSPTPVCSKKTWYPSVSRRPMIFHAGRRQCVGKY